MKVYDLNLLPTAVKVRVPDARKFTSDPARGAIVEISVDWSRIAKQLGPKAAGSKGKRAQCLSGAVKVKLVQLLEPRGA